VFSFLTVLLLSPSFPSFFFSLSFSLHPYVLLSCSPFLSLSIDPHIILIPLPSLPLALSSTSTIFTENMSINELSHPLLSTKLSELRDKRTPSHRFRSLIKDITGIVAIEASRDLELKDVPNVSSCYSLSLTKEGGKKGNVGSTTFPSLAPSLRCLY